MNKFLHRCGRRTYRASASYKIGRGKPSGEIKTSSTQCNLCRVPYCLQYLKVCLPLCWGLGLELTPQPKSKVGLGFMLKKLTQPNPLPSIGHSIHSLRHCCADPIRCLLCAFEARSRAILALSLEGFLKLFRPETAMQVAFPLPRHPATPSPPHPATPPPPYLRLSF